MKIERFHRLADPDLLKSKIITTGMSSNYFNLKPHALPPLIQEKVSICLDVAQMKNIQHFTFSFLIKFV